MAGFPDTPKTLIGRLSLNQGSPDWHRTWQTFQDLYLPAIRLTTLRAYMRYGWYQTPDHLVDDTVSDVVVALLKGQDKFQYDPSEGRFRGYVGQLIHWKVKDRLKAMRPEPHDTDETLSNEPGPDASAFEVLAMEEERAWRYSTLCMLLEEAAKTVSPQTYSIFQMTKLHAMPPSQVMTELGVTRATIDNANHRVMKTLVRLAGLNDYRKDLLP